MSVKLKVKSSTDRIACSYVDTNRGTFNMSLAYDCSVV